MVLDLFAAQGTQAALELLLSAMPFHAHIMHAAGKATQPLALTARRC